MPDDTCEWSDDGDACYQSDCGKNFVFNEDGPLMNGFVWCPFCGRQLTEGEFEGQEDDPTEDSDEC